MLAGQQVSLAEGGHALGTVRRRVAVDEKLWRALWTEKVAAGLHDDVRGRGGVLIANRAGGRLVQLLQALLDARRQHVKGLGLSLPLRFFGLGLGACVPAGRAEHRGQRLAPHPARMLMRQPQLPQLALQRRAVVGVRRVRELNVQARLTHAQELDEQDAKLHLLAPLFRPDGAELGQLKIQPRALLDGLVVVALVLAELGLDQVDVAIHQVEQLAAVGIARVLGAPQAKRGQPRLEALVGGVPALKGGIKLAEVAVGSGAIGVGVGGGGGMVGGPTETGAVVRLRRPGGLHATHSMRRKATREKRSCVVFSIGVPVRHQRRELATRMQACARLILWLRMWLASSSTTRNHLTRKSGPYSLVSVCSSRVTC